MFLSVDYIETYFFFKEWRREYLLNLRGSAHCTVVAPFEGDSKPV
jgi:hypothetical protein